MEELIRSFNDEKIVVLISGFISVYLALLVLMVTMRRNKTYRTKSDKEKAYELLLKSYEQQTLNGNAIFLSIGG